MSNKIQCVRNNCTCSMNGRAGGYRLMSVFSGQYF